MTREIHPDIELLPQPLEERLTTQTGMAADDIQLKALMANAKGNNAWTPVASFSGELPHNGTLSSEQIEFDDRLNQLAVHNGVSTTEALIHTVRNFDGETIPARAFYAELKDSAAWRDELFGSGQPFAITGSRDGVTRADFSENPYVDPVSSLWIPMADAEGQLPGFHILTTHTQPIEDRSAAGAESTYVGYTMVLTPGLQVFGPHNQ